MSSARLPRCGPLDIESARKPRAGRTSGWGKTNIPSPKLPVLLLGLGSQSLCEYCSKSAGSSADRAEVAARTVAADVANTRGRVCVRVVRYLERAGGMAGDLELPQPAR